MWTKSSMLKTTLKIHNNLDISKYGKMKAYLKSQSRTYKSKKAMVLEKEHIEEFLLNVLNSEHLMTKTALLMRIFGACRCQEQTNMKINDVEDKGSYLCVAIPDTKTNKPEHGRRRIH
ncbi:unnamed protein product [Tenebrio molitor]|nr:unnamed protein product [Tenebrio molitor]